ncbi:biotin--[acetyl-CoA-carboxylase] ligase [Novosphingobium sp. JCM 18896]|uniref:biotin--[acetyl-CoA-carboxylase] ligase n=1 Tax=Novosphingobium sp. JCM 18896 TaxID=2989731 RepID=UPI0022237A37|nr:biotin--[acetyl-CoA-carboxylase] ligase [Novosphingobium sp. JCM 18896]MCW1428528.1 biotin--[acetyl-CoA-carboxylase] ligase [Novosphingobium sp. JCM 18896]
MIQTLAETGSTNADLAARLRAGESVVEGDWLVADRQTAGKGRQGRDWFDAAGNFMGSTVAHLRFGDPEPASLALLAGLAVHAAVAPHLEDGASATLKWPNDLLVGRAKLAGILLERVNDSVVIGIGVNLAQAPAVADRETVALGGVDRDAFAAHLERIFAEELERWRHFGLAPVVQRWLAAAHPLGTPLTVGDPEEGVLNGTFAGLAEDGALLLRLDDGQTRAIHAGEVRLTPDA